MYNIFLLMYWYFIVIILIIILMIYRYGVVDNCILGDCMLDLEVDIIGF